MLDLRTPLLSGRDAAERAEAWLRERQASAAGEVLIVTGRGLGSDNGEPVVKPAVEQRLARLRRQGVVASVQEHTPGSLVVTLAPMKAMLDAKQRRRDPVQRKQVTPASLATLEPETRSLLRTLACRSLDELGAPQRESLIADEMLAQFAKLAKAAGPGPEREARLRAAITAALEEG
jgi:hypothetical protein